MRYMLMIYSSAQTWDRLSEAERDAFGVRHRELREELMASGEYISGGGLAGPAAGKAVRVRGGGAVVTDGPYLELKEHLAGHYVVSCDGWDRAVEIASRLPDAELCGIEIRPMVARNSEDER